MCARREKLEAGSKQSVQGKGKKEGKPYFAACFPRKHKTINKKLLSMNPLSMLGGYRIKSSSLYLGNVQIWSSTTNSSLSMW